jgi:hypothetical protein
MALLSDYTAGTVSVAADGTAVTGVGTAWLTAGFREGDLLFANGATGVVLSVNSNTSITLAQPWKGGLLNNAVYRLRYQGDNSRVTAQARQLIEMLGAGNISALSGLVGAADKMPYFTGAGTMSLATLTALSRTFLGGADAAAMRAAIAAFSTSGGTLSGKAISTGTTGNSGLGVATSNLGEFEARGNGTGAAMMTFHRPSSRAVYFGLDTDNELKIGGWSLGANAYRIRHDLNFVPMPLSATGGTETDLITSEQIRLQLGFTATGPALFANAMLSLQASATADVVAYLRVGDNVTGTYVAFDTRAISVSNALSYSQSLPLALAYNSLIVGRSYVLQLNLLKTTAVGPIYPRNMRVNALNF